MKFTTLYKTDASNWGVEGSGRGPKNHLSSESDLHVFCGRQDVVSMGGEIEYLNGVWFHERVKIPAAMMAENTCTKCFRKAIELIKEFESKL